MALKIRLRQQGRNNRPFYRLVLTDVRAPRDGKYLEALGWYNPYESELDKSVSVKADRVQHWLNIGAEISERAETLVAKVAPALIRAKQEKLLQHKAKVSAKKRAARKKKGAAVG
jgi:small subunit ribosomal protein S16